MSIKKFCKGIKRAAVNAKQESVAEFLKMSKITLISNREMTVEGNMTICRYDNTAIEISSDDIDFKISGKGLYLCYIKSNTIRITGEICDICFNQGRE